MRDGGYSIRYVYIRGCVYIQYRYIRCTVGLSSFLTHVWMQLDSTVVKMVLLRLLLAICTVAILIALWLQHPHCRRNNDPEDDGVSEMRCSSLEVIMGKEMLFTQPSVLPLSPTNTSTNLPKLTGFVK